MYLYLDHLDSDLMYRNNIVQLTLKLTASNGQVVHFELDEYINQVFGLNGEVRAPLWIKDFFGPELEQFECAYGELIVLIQSQDDANLRFSESIEVVCNPAPSSNP